MTGVRHPERERVDPAGRAQRGRRARARRAALVAAAALACAGLVAAVRVATGVPLEDRAGSIWSERGQGAFPVLHEAATGMSGKDVAYASLAERGRFTAGLDVGNTGRVDLRVTGLGHVDGPAGLEPRLWMDVGRFVYGRELRLVPFEPFTLRPGEVRYVAIGVELPGDASCAGGPPRFAGSIGAMPLRFERLGIVRGTARIELPRALGVVCGERPAPWPPRPGSPTPGASLPGGDAARGQMIDSE